MECGLSEQDLWSGLDRNAPEMTEHLKRCPTCKSRAESLQAGIEAVENASRTVAPALPDRIGEYVILRRLGIGGMGIVYEGQQQSPKRLVAIKVMRGGPAVDDYRVRLFQREAHTLALLKHASIAAIYEAGQTDAGEHFFAMELVHGVPLNEYVQDQNVPRRRRLELFGNICDAINYAHQRGVIHRDLKPSNILVGPTGSPKILDFGLARITDPDAALMTTINDAGRLMGTLPYMSPEEARGQTAEVDVRSDVYSLGVVLYELLTDQLPHAVRRAALHDAVRAICEERPRKPSAIDRSLRGDLETIALKALEKEPARRYQSAAHFADDVTRYLADQPILARRSSVLYQTRKFVVRHAVFVSLAVASVAAVTAGRVWVEWIDRDSRAQIQAGLIDRQELREAIITHQLADELRMAGKPEQAENHYRNALSTYVRLGEHERAGPMLTVLASLLVQRSSDADSDNTEAERMFLDALDIFDRNPSDWIQQRQLALEGLIQLYRGWDDPEVLAAREKELADLLNPPPVLSPAN